MSATRIDSNTEIPDLFCVLEQAIDVRIDVRLDALADRLGTQIARRLADILGSVNGPAIVDQLLLTVPEAARLLSLSRSTVYELMKSGDLTSVKVGGARRIPLDSIQAFRSLLQRAGHGARTPGA